MLRQAGDVHGLREFYERRLGVTEASPARLELHLRLGQLGESAPETLPLALSAYQAALALEPAELIALQGLRRLRLRMGETEAGALAWETEAAATRSRAGAVQAWLEAGRLWMNDLQMPERAIDAFERVLDLDPLDVEAAEAVESLLARKGGAAELASLNERRGQTRLASGDRPGAADEFFKAAQGWLDGVGDRGRALTALGRALEAEPEHADALELRAVLAGDQGRWSDAAEALEARLRIGGDAETLAALQLRLGVIYQEHLDQSARAVAAFNAALASVRSGEPLDRLATLHRASRNWTGVVDCLQQLRSMETRPVERARASLRLAEALSEGFDDGERSVTEAREAFPLLLEEPEALDRIVPLFERRGRTPMLLQLLDERAAPPCPPAGPRPHIRVRLAELYLRSLGDLSRAVAACRTAVELDPGSVEARAALADMLSKDSGLGKSRRGRPPRGPRPRPGAPPQPRDALRDLGLAAHAGPELLCRRHQRVHERGAAAGHPPPPRLEGTPPRRVALPGGCRGARTAAPPRRPESPHRGAPRRRRPGRPPLPARLRGPRGGPARGPAPLRPPDGPRHPPGGRGLRRRPLRRLPGAPRPHGRRDERSPEHLRRAGRRPAIQLARAEVPHRPGGVRESSSAPRSPGNFPKTSWRNLLGDCIRVVISDFDGLGRRDEERIRTLRKMFSRKTLRALENPAWEVAHGRVPDLGRTLQGLFASGNRAGLLVCGDPAVALTMVLREDPAFVSSKAPEAPESIVRAVRDRAESEGARDVLGVGGDVHAERWVGPTLPERAI